MANVDIFPACFLWSLEPGAIGVKWAIPSTLYTACSRCITKNGHQDLQVSFLCSIAVFKKCRFPLITGEAMVIWETSILLPGSTSRVFVNDMFSLTFLSGVGGWLAYVGLQIHCPKVHTKMTTQCVPFVSRNSRTMTPFGVFLASMSSFWFLYLLIFFKQPDAKIYNNANPNYPTLHFHSHCLHFKTWVSSILCGSMDHKSWDMSTL